MYAHLIFDLLAHAAGSLVRDGDIKVARVPRVGRTGELAGDVLAFGDREGIRGVEDGLPEGGGGLVKG